MKTVVPPIKSQGIKTKLTGWISDSIAGVDYDTWVEPFMGTGVVGFNIQPKKALMCDSNPHLINFYNEIKNGLITGSIVKKYLIHEGDKLLKSEGEYYYELRNRFNENNSSLDFLFLSRSCFNGMMRFNKKGGFNVPFCKKPNRFAPALITKIVNQVESVSNVIQNGDYTFKHQDFKKTLKEVNKEDIVYCDPPYIGRHVDYFDSWSEVEEIKLNEGLVDTGSIFILSTWLKNKYRVNEYVFDLWRDCHVSIKEHFYHVGGKESNRNAVYEALLSNIELRKSISNREMFSKLEELI